MKINSFFSIKYLKILSTGLLIFISAGVNAETVLERSNGLSSEACRRVFDERGLCFAQGLRTDLVGICAICPIPVFSVPAIADLVWNEPWKEVGRHKRHAHRLSEVKNSVDRAIEFLKWVEIAYQKRNVITEDPNFPQYYEKKFPEEFRKNLESVRQPEEPLLNLIIRVRDANIKGMNGLSERHDVDACGHFFEEVIEGAKRHTVPNADEKFEGVLLEEEQTPSGG